MRDVDITTRDLAGVTNGDDPAAESVDRTREGGEGREPLLPQELASQYKERWESIQATFVDEPRDSVEQADALVADLMQRLAAVFSEEREQLEAHWDGGQDVSTEDLRVALMRYRSFFDRLLST